MIEVNNCLLLLQGSYEVILVFGRGMSLSSQLLF